MVFGPGGKGIIPSTGSGMSTPDAVRRSSSDDSGARASERLALIEQLLLAGLDHYFIGQYEQAIHVWTRVFFLDRGHARARAYIERARGALAEHQREAEARGAEEASAPRHGGGGSMVAASTFGSRSAAAELTDTVPAALPRRRLSRRDLWRGVPESAILADRAAELAASSANASNLTPAVAIAAPAAGIGSVIAPAPRSGARVRTHVLLITLAVVLLCSAAYVVVARDRLAIWLGSPAESILTAPIANVVPEPLPLPRLSEQTMARARWLFARGHLHEALQTLAAVGADDPLRRDADTLLIEIERALLDAAGVRAGTPPRPSPLSER
jgi:hypothetical protein